MVMDFLSALCTLPALIYIVHHTEGGGTDITWAPVRIGVLANSFYGTQSKTNFLRVYTISYQVVIYWGPILVIAYLRILVKQQEKFVLLPMVT